MQVLIRWGDPVVAGAPAFDPANLTAAAQEKQFGYNNDYLGLHAAAGGQPSGDRFLLVVNHEYTNSHLMFPGLGSGRDTDLKAAKAQVDVEMAAHRRRGDRDRAPGRASGRWWRQQVRAAASPPTRRCDISGPAAGHELLKTSADPAGRKVFGTFNNCAGGVTPWGTWLTCEENFHVYFGGDAAKLPVPELHKRYGIRPRRPPTAGRATSTASTSARSPTRPTASAGWSRSTPTTRRDAGEAHRAGPLQA